MHHKLIKVKCYSGYTCPQEPKSFFWENREYQISCIETEWREPNKKIFKVRTGDERVFELCYNQNEDRWSVIELI